MTRSHMADAMKVSRVLPLPAANGRLVPTWAPPSLAPIRLLLVTDHTITCAGLRLLIESRPAFCIVGEAGDCHTALAVAADVHPHVVLLDLIGGAHKDIE